LPRAKTVYRVTLLEGDGSGPELVRQALRAVAATGVEISWDRQLAGEEALARHGTPLPAGVLESLRRNGVGLKGPITTPVGGGFRSVNVRLRQELDLYACLRPLRSYPGVRSARPGVNLVIVRENLEDLYGGIEFPADSPEAHGLRESVAAAGGAVLPQDSAVALKTISRGESLRIARFAFTYAAAHGRRRVTVGHKANILKSTDGLFLAAAREVGPAFPGIALDDVIVDNLCLQLVQRPEQFDVLLLPNLYGDIVSDLAAGLAGGLGLAPGANLGERIAVFEPTHGSAPSFRGTGRLNPGATMLSAALLLSHLGEAEASERLEAALARVLAEGRHVTFDLLPAEEQARAASTTEMTDAVVRALGA
jgi:isocitrate dehydrogenase (NAD+)